MPRDPVCGRTVEKTTPYKDGLNGETYYFCSAECMEEFEYSADEAIEPVLQEAPDLPD